MGRAAWAMVVRVGQGISQLETVCVPSSRSAIVPA